ncbi:MAG: hypothetical protein ACLQFR_03450 [Streptosporangiaceae bacterium]
MKVIIVSRFMGTCSAVPPGGIVRCHLDQVGVFLASILGSARELVMSRG